MAYTYDIMRGRFRDERGRFIPDATVRIVIDGLADAASARMATTTAKLQAGAIDLTMWQAEMMGHIRVAHTATGAIAYGGREQLSRANWGYLGSEIKAEYQYLRAFAEQIKDGTAPLDGRLLSRARQYGQASRVTFASVLGRERRMRGAQLERNILGGANHCQQCRDLTARGWVPVGTLPPLGSRSCKSSDRCRIQYRTEPAVAAA